MSDDGRRYLDANQIVYLPIWARYSVMVVLGVLALSACIAGLGLFFFPSAYDKITPTLSIAQTAAGAFAIVLFVLFAERELGTEKLLRKTDVFLEQQMADGLRKIEIPQLKPGFTVSVEVLQRASTIHGGRKDIFGANYEISLDDFKMRMWIGINVKRINVIYFVSANDASMVDTCKEAFHFTFAGAAKLGYDTNYQYAVVGNERLVSIWSTVMADTVVLGNPSEQLFWIQDIAMMTQSFIRTAVREQLQPYTQIEPGPL